MLTPDISNVYPKVSGTLDLQAQSIPHYVATGSMQFDGDELERLNAGDTSDGQMTTNSFSVTFWARTTNNSEMYVVSKQDAGVYDGYRFGFDQGKIRSSLKDASGTGTGDVNGVVRIDDGMWHHFGHTVDRTNDLFLCYVDGQLDKSADISSITGSIDASEDLIIGASYSGTNQNFYGALNNVGIWKSVVLTQAQIRKIMVAKDYTVVNNIQSPTMYWPLEGDIHEVNGTPTTFVGGIPKFFGDKARTHRAYDLTGKRHDARLYTGRAIQFSGSTSNPKVDMLESRDWELNQHYTGSTGATLSAWVKPEKKTFALIANGGYYPMRFGIGMSTTGEQFFVNSYGVPSETTNYRVLGAGTGSAANLGKWHHIVGTMGPYNTGSELKIYIDGKLTTGSGGMGTAGLDGNNRFYVGARGTNRDSNFSGSICHVKWFTAALSADQVAELYNNPELGAPGGMEDSLQHWWPMSEFAQPSVPLSGAYCMDLGGASAGNTNKRLLISHCTASIQNAEPCPQLGLTNSSELIYFDGVDDYAESDSTGIETNEFSISLWANAFSNGPHHETNCNYACLISAADSGNDYTEGFNIDLGSNEDTSASDVSYINVEGQGFDKKDYFSGSIAFGEWFHLGWVSTSASSSLYINGLHHTSSKRNNSTDNKLNKIRVGARKYSGHTGYFHGHITNVAIYDAELDANDMADIYNGGREFDLKSDSGNYNASSDLRHWWRTNAPYNVEDLSGSVYLITSGNPEMTTHIEGMTSSVTLAGPIENKRITNAVFNLGGSEYLEIPTHTDLNPQTTGFTSTIWIRWTGRGSGQTGGTAVLYDKTSNGNNRWYLRIRDDSGDSIQGNVGDGSRTRDVNGTSIITTIWHHVVMVVDYANDVGKIYLDGQQVGSDSDISDLAADCPSTDPLTIGGGARVYRDASNFHGQIALPKLYQTVLSANEVKQLYNNGKRILKSLE